MPKALDICVEFLKRYEGIKDGDTVKPGLQPYLCPAGVWTTGYGHAIVDPKTGEQLRGQENKARAHELWPEITLQESHTLLIADTAEFVESVTAKLKVEPEPCQLAALTSFAFNIGLGAFSSSTALQYTNEGNPRLARAAMLLFSKVNGKPNVGLLARRYEEAKLHEGLYR